MIFNKYRMSELGTVFSGGTPSTKNSEYWDGNISWITPKDLSGYASKYISKGERSITELGLNKSSATLIPKGSVLMSSRAPIGYVVINENEVTTNQGFKSICCNESLCLNEYIYYWIKNSVDYITSKANGSTFKEISGTAFKDLIVSVPSIEDQMRIVKVMKLIDAKIELNNGINNNLYDLINTIYKDKFSDVTVFKRADEFANITIGKTPPRSEHECFTNNESDVKWISISDLGKCGIYIYDTNEKLTEEAVQKYNVKVVPANTILLSFKLTVGRTAITTCDMTTNEAIAHFNLNDKDYMYYLYSYLNNYDYSKLGSTSSIATAVNSKIIKAMNIGCPEKGRIIEYNNIVKPIFEKIKINEQQNIVLSDLRDTLLPKLMNGEIDLDNIEI